MLQFYYHLSNFIQITLKSPKTDLLKYELSPIKVDLSPLHQGGEQLEILIDLPQLGLLLHK